MPSAPLILRAYADLHGNLPDVKPCDALLVAGDICPIGGEFGDHSPEGQSRWISEYFNPWIDSQPAAEVVLIGGNHDAILDPNHAGGCSYELHPKITYLESSGTQVCGEHGPKIWGQPWIPTLKAWPFYRTDDQLAQIAGAVPGGFDIWLLHGPPASDEPSYRLDFTKSRVHAGDRSIARRIEQLRPQLVVCGHIHEGFGMASVGSVPVANVALVDERYVVRDRHMEISFDAKAGRVASVELITEY